jgi:nucleotide-binding universal stress UspA family protein
MKTTSRSKGTRARVRSSGIKLPPVALKLRRILVPLDFSGQSRQALKCAVPLAAQFGATISLVHVVQAPVILSSLPEASIAMPTDIKRLTEMAQERLDKTAAELLPEKVRGKTLVAGGNPTYGITTTAKSLKADLIVLSTHGFTGLKHVLLGSAAEGVVRHAHCPVLTVRLRAKAPSEGDYWPWKRILVPLDFSQRSLRGLAVAVALAREKDAELCLLHVLEPAHYAAGMEGAVLAMPEKELIGAARTNLMNIAKRLVPANVKTTAKVASGRPATVIVQTAARAGADLIVATTHGHTGWERLLLGSTAEHIVRHATCPVFVVRQSK